MAKKKKPTARFRAWRSTDGESVMFKALNEDARKLIKGKKYTLRLIAFPTQQ